MSDQRAVLRALRDAAARGEPAVLATVTRTEGSSYRRVGTRMLIRADGSTVGIVSGGCLEADLVERAKGLGNGAPSQVVVYDSRPPEDLVWGLGLGCDGLVEVTLEWLSPEEAGPLAAGLDTSPVHLVICGQGPDVAPLVGLATGLEWDVTVIDHRQRHPSELAEAVPLTMRTYAVVMSHHFLRDLDYLRVLLASDAPYIGLLGPRSRAERLLRAITGHERVDPSVWRRVYAPAGLDIGGDGPDAIAIAIGAEVSAVAAGRAGGHLRDRRGPIHDAPPRRAVDAA